MGYIGNPPVGTFSSVSYQDLTGGSGTGFTLDYPVGSANEVEVFVNNVRQEPGVAYTVSGTTLTMTGTIASTDDFYVVFQSKAQQTATHPSGNNLQAVDGTFSGTVEITGNFPIWENSQTVNADYTITNSRNAMSAGPITQNATVTVNGYWSIV